MLLTDPFLWLLLGSFKNAAGACIWVALLSGGELFEMCIEEVNGVLEVGYSAVGFVGEVSDLGHSVSCIFD